MCSPWEMLEIVLFAVALACVRYAFPFVFKAKGGAGLPVLAAREMERDPPIPALLLSPFSRGLTSLTLVPRSLLRNRTETFAR